MSSVPRRLLIALGAFVLLQGMLLATAVPLFQAPDEPAHLLEALRKGGLMEPTGPLAEADLLETLEHARFYRKAGMNIPEARPQKFNEAQFSVLRPTQRTKPPIYYMAVGLLLRLSPFQSIPAWVILARWIGVLLTAAAVLLVAVAAGQATGDARAAAAAGVLAATLPQLFLIGCSVNSDALLTPLAAVAAVACFAMVRQGRRVRLQVLLAAALLGALLTRRSGAVLALPALVALLAAPSRSRAAPSHAAKLRRLPWGILVSWSAAGALILTGAAAPGLLRRAVLEAHGALSMGFAGSGADLDAAFWITFLRILAQSVYYVGGWMKLFAPGWVYALALGVALIALAGLARPGGRLPWRVVLVALAGGAAPLAATLAVYGMAGRIAQGRYLFPALGFLLPLLGAGLARLPPWLRKACLTVALLLDLVVVLLLVPLGYLSG